MPLILQAFYVMEHIPLKRFRDYNSYLREIFGERVQKISLDAGLSCPNRDGGISDAGCIFCDSRGSGTGAYSNHRLSIDEQIVRARTFLQKRYKSKKFIAYFQSFTNTHAPCTRLKEIYDQALNHQGIVGLSVATRPDCVDHEILGLLGSYKKDYLVWIEYGLQSAHDVTLSSINRGHDAACFEKSVYMANDYGLNTCAHVILGLPGETREMMRQTARFLAELPVKGVKIHLKKGEFRCLERGEYVELVVDFLELLPPAMVIQRITGDPIRSELVAPLWANDKSKNRKLVMERLEERDAWQGKQYQASIARNYNQKE
jgi:radical SAM protein (TIGR01212 family)